jgi:hypothetical protein
MQVAHDTHHLEKLDQFRLHNGSAKKQSREVNRISKMFSQGTKVIVPAQIVTATTTYSKSESHRPENLTQSNGIENG